MKQQKTEPVYISVKEAAARASISERSLRQALREGRLRAGRWGARRLLRWRDVEDLILKTGDDEHDHAA